MRIDAHQHFWQYNAKEYEWITESMPDLKQDRYPSDLYPLLEQHCFDGCIAVQARQSIQENHFLLTLAAQHSWIMGIVGWIDLRSDDLETQLEHWNDYPVIKGYRHLVQDEANPSALLDDPLFNRGVEAILRQGKCYEILIHAKDLTAATRFCARHDHQPLILDHLGKPNIQHESALDWAKRLKPLAQQQHVFCKLSGIITEASPHWTEQEVTPYIEQALVLFGPDRLMFGSDWPVCLLAGEYQQVYQLIEKTINQLSSSEQQAIFGHNACRLYQLNPKENQDGSRN